MRNIITMAVAGLVALSACGTGDEGGPADESAPVDESAFTPVEVESTEQGINALVCKTYTVAACPIRPPTSWAASYCRQQGYEGMWRYWVPPFSSCKVSFTCCMHVS